MCFLSMCFRTQKFLLFYLKNQLLRSEGNISESPIALSPMERTHSSFRDRLPSDPQRALRAIPNTCMWHAYVDLGNEVLLPILVFDLILECFIYFYYFKNMASVENAESEIDVLTASHFRVLGLSPGSAPEPSFPLMQTP